MFRRIYDRNVGEVFEPKSSPPWWSIDVSRNANRLVVPEPGEEDIADDKKICVCHDIERGMGHKDSDPDFAGRADASSLENLERMLSIERDLGIKATYAVVGTLVPELRGRIEEDGHGLAFHSYDHRIDESTDPIAAEHADQLMRCRAVDYRLKGYRAPQSRITTELTDENLCFHNFEWLASSAFSFGFNEPCLQNRIVKIPIYFDDFWMHRDGLAYDAWETEAIATIENNRFVAFGLHDCYGELWLPRYARFLEKIRRLGRLMTVNQVADEVFLQNALSLREEPAAHEAID
jgi:peptidoglycan/xylan/chitin deacetylase (PgdA/CDA1 family)